ncbi:MULTISPECIES: prealbumin-like fold domain-containing protein [Coprobacillaceae]|uniref:prealbumin-like fold domain-containing protein n=1 Tax=Coprobacillaceae TaxID=2810280 RepID=UPI000E4B7BC2|nr:MULTISPECIES: prealbumin-like fold domain-containing protein [Coprobacillaceae]RHM62126.1 hypothetical protein DWZ53_03630 [Coprobacillus sp. AF33-1AC]RHS96003.1 hypothetical protein DW911_01325 [Erysipelatoclostridium sp. AM42-17]
MKRRLFIMGMMLLLLFTLPVFKIKAKTTSQSNINYKINVTYIDQESQKQLAHSIIKQNANTHYNLNRSFKGYQQVKIKGDEIKGLLNQNKYIEVYYTPYRSCLTVKLKKENNQALKGTVMVLYKKENGKEQIIEMSHQESQYSFTSLKDGKYLLYQNKVPKGYIKLNKPIEIRIKKGKIYHQNKSIHQLIIKNKQIKKSQKNPHQQFYLYIIVLLILIRVMFILKTYYKNKQGK